MLKKQKVCEEANKPAQQSLCPGIYPGVGYDEHAAAGQGRAGQGRAGQGRAGQRDGGSKSCHAVTPCQMRAHTACWACGSRRLHSACVASDAPLPRLQGFHHMLRMRLTTSGVMRGSIDLCSIKLGLLKDNLPCCTYRDLILLLHLGVSHPACWSIHGRWPDRNGSSRQTNR